MKRSVRISLIAILVAGLTVLLVKTIPPVVDGGSISRDLSDGNGDARPESEESPPREKGAADFFDEPEEGERTPLRPAGRRLLVRVTDEASGDPVTRFFIRLGRRIDEDERKEVPSPGTDPSGYISPEEIWKRDWIEIASENVDDDNGLFRCSLERGGRHVIGVFAKGFLSRVVHDLEIPGDAGTTEREIPLDRGKVFSGRVIDDETGEPVAQATITAPGFLYVDFEHVVFGELNRTPVATSGADGTFLLSGMAQEDSFLRAGHPAYAVDCLEVEAGQERAVLFRLTRGFHVFGKVLDDDGRPGQGVRVHLSGKNGHRAATSGPDGRYRTPPAHRGTCLVTAFLPQDETSPAKIRFTTETRRAVIVDRDVEVNFGPRPDHVAWSGVLYGYDGVPQGEGWIIIELLRSNSGEEPSEICLGFNGDGRVHTESDREGRFEIRKIVPGAYSVTAHLSDGMIARLPDPVVFEGPGEFERDIRLDKQDDAFVIGGIVVDGNTGAPLRAPSVTVRAAELRLGGAKRRAATDGEGRFRICGIPAGAYTLSVRDDRLPGASCNVSVGRGQERCDVRIVLPARGEIRVALEGFDAPEAADMEIELRHENGRRLDLCGPDPASDGNNSHPYNRIDELGHPFGTWTRNAESGRWEIRSVCETGAWTVHFFSDELGFVCRRAEVVAGSETRCVIHKDALAGSEKDIALSGGVYGPDGAPLAGVRLMFSPDTVPAGSGDDDVRVGTDALGRYSTHDLGPGIWNVYLWPGGNRFLSFEDLSISGDRVGPLVVDFRIAAGSVTGFLFDRWTDLPLKADGTGWQIRLVDVDTQTGYRARSFSDHEGTGSPFRLTGVSRGSYILRISVPSYAELEFGPVSCDGTGEVDLGGMGLTPLGSLDLKVLDRQGLPVTEYEMTCNGKRFYSFDRKESTPGRYRYDCIPAGRIRLRIRTEKHEIFRGEVDILPGKTSPLLCTVK